MTSSDIKKLAPVIKEEIDKASHILLHLHPTPDPDCTGSALAMMHVLLGMGKQVTVIAGDSLLPTEFKVFPGYERIIQKNFFEIDLSEFDLFIAVDTGGINQISKLRKPEFPAHLRVVVIDHHFSNEGFGYINLIKTDICATGELLYKLFKEWKVDISPQIAIGLLAGIHSDSQSFTLPLTTPETVAICAELAGHYPGFSDVLFELNNSATPEQLALEGAALSNLTMHFGGRVAIATIPFEAFATQGTDSSRVGKLPLASKLRTVRQWDIAIGMIEERKDWVRASMRCRDIEMFDLTKVAKALGGGGHKGAAGVLLEFPLEEAKQKILDAIAQAYPFLGNP